MYFFNNWKKNTGRLNSLTYRFFTYVFFVLPSKKWPATLPHIPITNTLILFVMALEFVYQWIYYPSGIYLIKGSNRNTRTNCEICSKLTIKTPEWRRSRCSGVFIVNFENISRDYFRKKAATVFKTRLNLKEKTYVKNAAGVLMHSFKKRKDVS